MKSIRNSFVCNTPIAHRGLHEKGVPENSRAAFTRAIEEGYAIETDVRRTKDGTLVVVHDDNLRRLTGEPGKVSQTSYHDLSAMRLAGTNERILTLEECLEHLDGRTPLLWK
ncbi:MAG: glycerophosphodiester phosphodiesterase family protein [Christensenellaceae bacterium]